MDDKSVADLRRKDPLRSLSETNVDPNPFKQIYVWFSDAMATNLIEPNAMTLATSTRDGKLSARTVLLRGFDVRGFVFYTNKELLTCHQ